MPSYGRRKKYTRRKRGTANRYSKKTRYNRRKKYSRGIAIARTPNVVFPESMYKCLTYSSGPIKLQQSTPGLCVSTVFAGNDLFDPDVTNVGHQPRWFDTLCGATGGTAPYNRYLVNASRIKVTVWQDPTLSGLVGSVAGVVSAIPLMTSAGSPPSSLSEIYERAYIRKVEVNNANSSKPLVFKHFAKTKALWMNSGSIAGNTDFSAVYNSSPVRAFQWFVQACNVIPGAGSNFSCYINVDIKYYIKFWSLNNVGQS